MCLAISAHRPRSRRHHAGEDLCIVERLSDTPQCRIIFGRILSKRVDLTDEAIDLIGGGPFLGGRDLRAKSLQLVERKLILGTELLSGVAANQNVKGI